MQAPFAAIAGKDGYIRVDKQGKGIGLLHGEEVFGVSELSLEEPAGFFQ